MTKEEFINKVQGGLIVSCQALEDEPLYQEEQSIMPLMAKAALSGGAAAIRTSGVRDVIAIKKEIDLPVIGLIKKIRDGFEPYITVCMEDIDQLVEANADVVAIDCTNRLRPDGLGISEFIKKVKEKYPNQLILGDISTLEEAIVAAESGCDFVATTLSGYTNYTENDPTPNFNLVKAIKRAINIPIIAEGRIHYPHQAKMMLEIGASAVVVGGAITRPQEITKRFIDEINS